VVAGAGARAAAEDEGASTYGVQETISLDVDRVGDVSHEYVLVYDSKFFDTQGANFEEYPFLLFRRYRAMEDVDEIQGFDAALDREAGRVRLTFREAGRAYNMGDRWFLYGLSGRPAKVVDGEVIIREETTENNDFTLWQDLAFATTTRVSLPEGAEHVRWDDDELALTWQTPEQFEAFEDSGASVLQQHRLVFTLLFSALMAASLCVAAVVLTRSRAASV
jgi:hypothetical protein